MPPSPYRLPGRSPPATETNAPARPPLVAVLALFFAVALVAVLNRASERTREKTAGGIAYHVTIVDVLLDADPR